MQILGVCQKHFTSKDLVQSEESVLWPVATTLDFTLHGPQLQHLPLDFK